jgi:hypothetical protein
MTTPRRAGGALSMTITTEVIVTPAVPDDTSRRARYLHREVAS